ncbi:MAG: hypothetical protein WC843_06695 [Candidatus Gracilibacteria bacterium]|jgi:ABC-type phosphate transport system permease subunit
MQNTNFTNLQNGGQQHGVSHLLPRPVGAKTFWLWLLMVVISVMIAFGFGYFFGRYEQIQINKSLLKIIPDINCGVRQP